MTDYRRPTGNELRDAIRELLPCRTFEIATHSGYGLSDVHGPRAGQDALIVRCRCGRVLRWPTAEGSLPADILLYWLADHDDDMFLTPGELTAKQEEQMHRVTFGTGPGASSLHAQISAEFPDLAAGLPGPRPLPEGGRPLLHDPDGALHRGDPA